jgi:hypothetical protein
MKTKTKSSLLTNPSDAITYRINMILTGNETAQFDFSNRMFAREHYEFLRARCVLGTAAIKEITWEEL